MKRIMIAAGIVCGLYYVISTFPASAERRAATGIVNARVAIDSGKANLSQNQEVQAKVQIAVRQTPHADEHRLVAACREIDPDLPEIGIITVPDCRIRLIDDVQLASEQSGILLFVSPEGSRILAGSAAAQIRDDVVRAQLAVAEKEASNNVDVRFARKATEFAQLKYLRAVEANRASRGTVSDLELRELRLQAEKSLLQLEQSEQQFLLAGLRRDEARARVNAYRVVAPFNAVVLNVYKKAGEVVQQGERILEIASTIHVRVEGHLPVDEVYRVRRGSPVSVRIELSDRAQSTQEITFTGRVGFVGVKVEPISRRVRFWADVVNRDNLLRDGSTATLTIQADTESR